MKIQEGPISCSYDLVSRQAVLAQSLGVTLWQPNGSVEERPALLTEGVLGLEVSGSKL